MNFSFWRGKESLSMLESSRIPLSAASDVSKRGGTQTGAISAVRRPSCVPAEASRFTTAYDEDVLGRREEHNGPHRPLDSVNNITNASPRKVKTRSN